MRPLGSCRDLRCKFGDRVGGKEKPSRDQLEAVPVVQPSRLAAAESSAQLLAIADTGCHDVHPLRVGI